MDAAKVMAMYAQQPGDLWDYAVSYTHLIIYQEYGRGAEDGYRICHYNPNGGYQTDLSEVVDEVEPHDGTQTVSYTHLDSVDPGLL